MVGALFLITFVVAFVIASIVVLLFNKPITSNMQRVVPEDICHAWVKYLRFALCEFWKSQRV